jgi:TRAP-type C4-dicarboxylate transport system substrate-binding protein
MRAATTLITGAVVLAVTGCSISDAARERAGAQAPMVVQMADSQPADAPTGLAMAAFAAAVDDLSRGTIVVKTTSGGRFADNHGDAKVVAALRAGDVQLAVVPTRAWADAGARSIEVLQAPFELQDDAHMLAVARDTGLVEQAARDVQPLGGHVLGVLPERLRYLTSFGPALLSPRDLASQQFRTFSPSIGKLVAPMNASAVNPDDDTYAAMRADGTLRGTDADMVRATAIAAGTTITVDLVLYAKFDSITANAAWWQRLSPSQRDVMSRAVEQVKQLQEKGLPDSLASAKAFCDAGGVLVAAGPEAIRDFRRAVEPYTSTLDPALLKKLRADRPRGLVAVPRLCSPPSSALDPAHVVAQAGTLPNGVYRYVFTPELARRFNEEHPDGIVFEGQDAVGAWKTLTVTWRLESGHYTFEMQKDDQPTFAATGIYQVAGDQMLLKLHPEIGNVVNRLAWRVSPAGDLILTQVDNLPTDNYYALPWKRISD